MVWKRDVYSLTSNSQTTNLNVSKFVDIAAHKDQCFKVLELGPRHSQTVLSKLRILDYTIVDAEEKETGGRNLLPGSEIAIPALPCASFSGVDVAFPSSNSGSLLLATALKPEQNGHADTVDNKMALVYRNEPATIASQVGEAAKDMGCTVRSTTLKDCVGTPGEQVVMLADFEDPLLATLQEDELAGLRNLTTSASSILWVTWGGLLNGKVPGYGMVAGLARSIISENASLDFRTLDFDAFCP
ncbi:MAG: hypothetical protein Q9213_007042 [Squamulea squamosa]